MTLEEAIAYVRDCGEDDGPLSYEEAVELFEAVFERTPEDDEGDAGRLWSHVCAAVEIPEKF